MFYINPDTNRLEQLEKPSFTALGLREVQHLQEWLANQPDVFGEPLLIIQKEFDGFHDTNERLDLLALDQKGNIVVIENKLDDTGRDVVWQGLKYASYCSTLTKDQIISIFQAYLDRWEPNAIAQEKLEAFFPYGTLESIEWNSQQRLILVAAHFRKEVTSTVFWLMNHKVRIQCFKTEPFRFKGQTFLKLDQIIPAKDTEEYLIKMADKVQEEQMRKDEFSTRHHVRIEFWNQLLAQVKGKMPVFQSNIAIKDNVLYAGGTDLASVNYIFSITGTYCAVGLVIGKALREENKAIFDYLEAMRPEIEAAFGSAIEWERQSENIRSLLTVRLPSVNVFNKSDWLAMISFMVETMARFEAAFRKPLSLVKLNQKSIFETANSVTSAPVSGPGVIGD